MSGRAATGPARSQVTPPASSAARCIIMHAHCINAARWQPRCRPARLWTGRNVKRKGEVRESEAFV